MSRPGQEIDPADVPWLSMLLGFGPVAPLPLAGGLAFVFPSVAHAPSIALVVLWASALLIFIAGVRRGYGFARAPAPSLRSLLGTIWIFAIGVAALPVMLVNFSLALILLLVGYGSVALLDRIDALRGEAPRHFAKLRPPQMALGGLGLVLLLGARAG